MADGNHYSPKQPFRLNSKSLHNVGNEQAVNMSARKRLNQGRNFMEKRVAGFTMYSTLLIS